MRVSVVIPAYNEEKHIGRCLKSLSRQKEKPDEIIVVDNNCTDKTVKIAQKFGAKIIKEEKQGMIYARNAGFNKARFGIIARTDADSILPKDWILRIKEKLKNRSIGAISGPAYYFRAPSKLQFIKFINRLFFRLVKALTKQDSLFGPNMALRKSVWKKVAKDVCLNDRDVHEDIDLAIHLRRYAKTKFYNNLVIKTSFRRGFKLQSYYLYSRRLIKTLRSHKKLYSS